MAVRFGVEVEGVEGLDQAGILEAVVRNPDPDHKPPAGHLDHRGPEAHILLEGADSLRVGGLPVELGLTVN